MPIDEDVKSAFTNAIHYMGLEEIAEQIQREIEFSEMSQPWNWIDKKVKEKLQDFIQLRSTKEDRI